MPKTITLEVTHPDGTEGKIEGFQFFWARYVDGFNSDVSCQKSLQGAPVEEFNSRTAAMGKPVVLDRMDRFPFLYVCGVAMGDREELYRKNFHLPLGHQEGAVVSALTYNGYIVTARNAVLLQIPSLKEDVLRDSSGQFLPEGRVRCKNFQFGVDRFGYPSPVAPGATQIVPPASALRI